MIDSKQDALPKLPVPGLTQTLDKYLKSVHPLLTPDEFIATQRITKDFALGEGPLLQKLLYERAEKKDNWLNEWWKDSYLAMRVPLPVYVTPVAISRKLRISSQQSMLQHSAYLLQGLFIANSNVLDGKLTQDMIGNTPLCMNQYLTFLSYTRQPGLTMDYYTKVDKRNSRYAIVAYKGNMFKFTMHEEHDIHKPKSPQELYSILCWIVNTDHPKSVPVGVLTSLPREEWYHAKQEMILSPTNQHTFDLIENSYVFFKINEPLDYQNINLGLYRTAMLGDMRDDFSYYDVWFDIPSQTSITPNAGIFSTLEHSLVDGQVAIYFTNLAVQHTLKHSSDPPLKNTPPSTKIDLLQWNISPATQATINDAKIKLRALDAKIKFNTTPYKGFGKNFIKSFKLSTDSLIQVAIQVAYYRLHSKPVACYESSSTRQFRDSRTETIRSTSVEAVQFSQAMCDTSRHVTREEKLKLLFSAIESHKKYAIDTFNGNGIDRHLLGLKLIALENGFPLPEFFKDKIFTESTHFRLSTSQLLSDYFNFFGYGPLVEDGYSLCYHPNEYTIQLTASSYNTCQANDCDKLVSMIATVLDELKLLLLYTQQLSPKSKI